MYACSRPDEKTSPSKHLGEGLEATATCYLQTIMASARRMGQFIDDLLAFSRMGCSVLRTQPVALDALLRAVQVDDLGH